MTKTTKTERPTCAVCERQLVPCQVVTEVDLDVGVQYADNLWALDGRCGTRTLAWGCRHTCADPVPIKDTKEAATEWADAWLESEMVCAREMRTAGDADLRALSEQVDKLGVVVSSETMAAKNVRDWLRNFLEAHPSCVVDPRVAYLEGCLRRVWSIANAMEKVEGVGLGDIVKDLRLACGQYTHVVDGELSPERVEKLRAAFASLEADPSSSRVAIVPDGLCLVCESPLSPVCVNPECTEEHLPLKETP